MRRCRALIGALTAALCVLLALALATDSAVTHPGGPTPAAGTPYTAVAAAPVSPVAVGQGRGAANVEHDRHPGPFDDCRHRRAIRVSAAVSAPQSEPCACCAAPEPAVHPARTPESVTGHAAVAAVPDPGERPSLLQVFRC
ncbi:hypothetical protein QIS99_21760 [Streptomyces sp. B-S-A8]|uniref:Secreted protein n=1 Tax=Streptomyces solicavernae TaxID=3043614 RepID=A0ABT6RWH9_9ACTN|nr:hypothetical protein [Streptomyces sp. B-S-A8]MDI3388797.1 hypothetical protein [Streptomyces sp. B-S-A8]